MSSTKSRLFSLSRRIYADRPGLLHPRTIPRRLYSQQHQEPSNPHAQKSSSSSNGNIPLNVGFNPPGPNTGGSTIFPFTSTPLFDAALTTLVGIGIVFVGGVAYLQWYKWNVLNKVHKAFAPGYDPALELATHKAHPEDELERTFWTHKPRRKEQETIDHIVHGHEAGHYYILLGPKGSGKGTMVLDAMATCQADGVAMCDAHPDLEVFRLRFGKALNFEFNEDSQTGLFQRRDPREGGPRLDIERALNKLEKVALRSYQKRQKPLILVINNVHHFKNDDEGRNMLLQLQQKAEAWAASGIVTMVFTSDDFWPIHVMRMMASRMTVKSISNLTNNEASKAVSHMRSYSKHGPATEEEIDEVVTMVGGRLSYLNQVAKAKDMVSKAKHLLAVEKGWLLSQIGLIPDCDDDVMDEQKWSSCSWLLLQEFVKLRQQQEKERKEAIEAGTVDPGDSELPLPTIAYWKCRQIMTRADFMEDLDRLNVISTDIDLNVRPDSMLILHAAREVVEEEGFEELLENVRNRIDEIESLHRTRELTFKDVNEGDMVRLSVDKGGAKLYETLRGSTS